MMESKNWWLVAGLASFLGGLLALIFCVKIVNHQAYIRPDRHLMIWLFYAGSSSISYFARRKISKVSGPYIHPFFRVFLTILIIISFIGLFCSYSSKFNLFYGSFAGIITFANNFLDAFMMLLLVISISVGVRDIKRYFRLHFSSSPQD
jgi:hypothetical protein